MNLPTFIRTTYTGDCLEKHNKKTYFTFLKNRVPQNTASKTVPESESQPNISFRATFMSEIQTSVEQPFAGT